MVAKCLVWGMQFIDNAEASDKRMDWMACKPLVFPDFGLKTLLHCS
jgi:hypothetical protein